MSENEYTSLSGVKVIVNGGDPLPGCPESWDEAYKLVDQLNKGKEDDEPKWKFDCGFKLDFDGPLVSVCSRFYPPKNHYGPTWDGCVAIYINDEDVCSKSFDCKDINDLKNQVKSYVDSIVEKLKAALKDSA